MVKIAEYKMDGEYLREVTLISDTYFVVHAVQTYGWKLPRDSVVEIHIVRRKQDAERKK